MKKTMIVTSVLVLLSVLLSACNLQGASPTQMGPDQINTIAAATVQALTTQMAPPPATATPLPTEMPTATATLAVPTLNLTGVPTLSLSTSTLIPLPTTSGGTSCNQIGAVEDVTIPDNSVIRAGQWFDKRWKLTNAGTCTWTTAYNANFVSGDTLQGDVSAFLRSNVPPGASIEVAVKLKAPTENGTYRQYWNLTDADGKPFGIGPSGANYWILFKVGATSGTTGGMSTVATTGACAGGTVTIDGSITLTSGAADLPYTAKYYYTVDDIPVTGSNGSVTFNSFGTLNTTSKDATGLAAGDHYAKIYITGGSIVPSVTVASFNCP